MRLHSKQNQCYGIAETFPPPPSIGKTGRLSQNADFIGHQKFEGFCNKLLNFFLLVFGPFGALDRSMQTV